MCARTAVMGAYLNVKINAAQLKVRAWADDVVARGAAIVEAAQRAETETIAAVESRM